MKILFFYILSSLIGLCYSQQKAPKINGANLVAPPSSEITYIVDLKKTNTNWVAVIPYAFIKENTANVIFDTKFQWWGERSQGVEQTIKKAKAEGFKIMLKPHIWVSGDGWAGDFTLNTETDWKQWEQSYTQYILTFCKIAKKYDVELFCIGTELRQVVKNRPLFWNKLILKIRSIYNGKLTYAANWDNYQNITFWEELDYIGIDSYFPLSKEKSPSINALQQAWNPIKTKLKTFSNCNATPILFTEFGYPSTEFCTSTPWKENSSFVANQRTQSTAYEAIFSAFWNEYWLAGGFFWKWHISDTTKRNFNKSYTPQGKKALQVITKWYKK